MPCVFRMALLLYFHNEVIILKITDICKQKNNTERYNIYVDDSFSFSALAEDIIKYNIKISNEYSKDELNDLIKKCEYAKAYEYALKILSIRDFSVNDLKNKLKTKSYSEYTIKGVIQKLKSYDLLNDEKYANKLINDSLRFKKDGINKIKYQLKTHGIKNDIIDNIKIDNKKEYENAYDITLKKYKLIKGKGNEKEKLYRYLSSKGYEYDTIKKVINEIIKDADDEELE